MKRIVLSIVWLCFSIGAGAQWNWQNPLPQGNTLRAVTFPTAQTGYMAGEQGTILKTTDQGETYTILSTGTRRNLNAIYFSDAWSGIAIGDSGTILTTKDGGDTWTFQATGIDRLIALSFINSDTGYITGSRTLGFTNTGFIQKTTDGGKTWTEILTNPNYEYNTILFTDACTGFTAGIRGLEYVCFLLKTTDCGETWQEMNTPYCQGDPILSLSFPSAQTGYAGSISSIFKTVDSGQHWARIDSFSYGNNALHFIDDLTGFVVSGSFDPFWGVATGYLYATNDGGLTWSKSSEYRQALIDLAFPDQLSGLVVGGDGIVLKTQDQGITWQTYAEIYQRLVKIVFLDEKTGYACGDGGALLATSNGGDTWRNISFQEPWYTQLTDIQFIHPDTGFISHSNAGRPIDKIYTSYDAWKTWREDTLDININLQQLWFINSNQAFAIAANGTNSGVMFSSTDKGFTWTPVSLGSFPLFRDIAFFDELTGIVVGESGTILRTGDGGVNWVPVSSGTTESLINIRLYNTVTGYITGGNHILLKTEDAGLTWNQILENPLELDQGIMDLVFPTEMIGYLMTSTGLYKSIDGGANWVEISGALPIIRGGAIYFTDAEVGYFAGRGGKILKTTNGGATFTEEPVFTPPGQCILYPNPAKTYVSIFREVAFEDATLNLIAYDGRVLETRYHQNGHQLDIDLGIWPDGLYFVSMTDLGSREVRKLILLRN